jgi:hypothetical protein
MGAPSCEFQPYLAICELLRPILSYPLQGCWPLAEG